MQGIAVSLARFAHDARASGLGLGGDVLARVVVDHQHLVDGLDAAEIAHRRGDRRFLVVRGEHDRDAVALPQAPNAGDAWAGQFRPNQC